MRGLAITLLFVFVGCQIDGPADDPDSGTPVPYLGQTPPGATAQLFAPGLVSTEDGELNAVFSSDSREFYFTRRGIPVIPPAIMVSRRGPDGWGIPENVGFDSRYSAIDLFISADDQRMVFCSDRPHTGEGPRKPDHDFWFSEREGDGWGEPRLFALQAVSEWQDFYPVVTESGNLYFNSQRAGPGTNNIFKSIWDGASYGSAEMLPSPINSEHREFDALVSPEEDLIVFSSDRPGGFGRSDIYVSFLENGLWTEPKNLGRAVNSEAAEYGSMFSPDGEYFFFTSSRTGMEDIYWVDGSAVFSGKEPTKNDP